MKNQFNKIDFSNDQGKVRAILKNARRKLILGGLDIIAGTATLFILPQLKTWGIVLIVWGTLIIFFSLLNASKFQNLPMLNREPVAEKGITKPRLTFSSFYWFNNPEDAQDQGVELLDPIGKIGVDTIYQTAKANGFTYKFLRIQKDKEIAKTFKGIGIGKAIYGLTN